MIDPNAVRLQGYAAIVGNEFEYFDPYEWKRRRMMVDPGAFAGVLARLAGAPLPIYWSHKVWGLQIGETTEILEDSRGLWFEGLPFATALTIDTLTVIDGRSRTGASLLLDFGEVVEDNDGVEHVLSVSQIYEVGPTPEGANPEAYAEIVPRTATDAVGAVPPPTPAVEPGIEEGTDAALAAAIYRATAQLRRL